MIHREELKSKLKKYNYQVKEQYGDIFVKLDSTIQIKIHETEEGRVLITDKLIGYNMLTGVWCMSVKNSIVFNIVGSFLYLMLITFVTIDSDKMPISIMGLIFLVFALGWIIFWTLYYLVKIENFKTLIQIWDK